MRFFFVSGPLTFFIFKQYTSTARTIRRQAHAYPIFFTLIEKEKIDKYHATTTLNSPPFVSEIIINYYIRGYVLILRQLIIK